MKPKILLVDDVPANIEVLANALQADYQILVATRGERALVLAQEQNPDLILLDVMMPEIDGYEVCRLLKQDPATSNIPVIFVTAMTQTDDEQKGFEVGAVDYIHKPFKLPVVRARVNTHVQLKQQTDLLRAVAQMGNRGYEQAEALVADIRRTLEKL